MGEIRREGISVIDGEVSRVLARSPDQDAEEGWSVVQRPYRSPPTEELFRDACTQPMTCLLGGNRVHMADGTAMPIELVRAGDRVMTMSGPRRIEQTETTVLGLTRRVIELRGLGDQVLLLSSDHPLWVSRKGKEWWGTYNIHHFLYELNNCASPGLCELPFILKIDLPEQVAHETGWLHVRPVFHDLPASTPLHHLVVQDGFSFIAEGFPVHSHSRDQQGPAAPWTGLDRGASVTHALGQLVPNR